MIDASRSIKACAAYYGDNADAMESYLKEGEKKALELGNRGPIKFDENGNLCRQRFPFSSNLIGPLFPNSKAFFSPSLR